MALPARKIVTNGKLYEDMLDADQNFADLWAWGEGVDSAFQANATLFSGILSGSGLGADGALPTDPARPLGSGISSLREYIEAVAAVVVANQTAATLSSGIVSGVGLDADGSLPDDPTRPYGASETNMLALIDAVAAQVELNKNAVAAVSQGAGVVVESGDTAGFLVDKLADSSDITFELAGTPGARTLVARIATSLVDPNHDHAGVYALFNHTHPYAPVSHTHPYAPDNHIHDYSGLFAALGHNHTGVYSAAGHDHDGDYAPAVHTHPYAPSSHTHGEEDLPMPTTTALSRTGTVTGRAGVNVLINQIVDGITLAAVDSESYETILSITGAGSVSFLAAGGSDSSAVTVYVRVTIDGNVVSEINGDTGDGQNKGFVIIGAGAHSGASYSSIALDDIPFSASLLVEAYSAVGVNTQLGYAYRLA